MLKNYSTIAKRNSFLINRKSIIITIFGKLCMGAFLFALFMGVLHSYKSVQNKYHTVKQSLQSQKEQLQQLALHFNARSAMEEESSSVGSFEISINEGFSESPVLQIESASPDAVIVVPEIERSENNRKNTLKIAPNNKCTSGLQKSNNCDHSKADCCTIKKCDTAAPGAGTGKEQEVKKKAGISQKPKSIPDQKHFGVGLRFTI